MKITPEQQAQRAALAKEHYERAIASRKLRIAEREFVITAPREEDPDDEPDHEPGSLFDRR